MCKLDKFVDRLNLKSASILFVFMLAIAGIYIISKGVTEPGMIEIESQVLSSRISQLFL